MSHPFYSTETGQKRKRRTPSTEKAKRRARQQVDTSVTTHKIPEEAMKVARKLAGDTGRIRIDGDGAVYVENA